MHLLPTVLQQLVTAGSRMESHARHDHDVVYTSLRERLKERFGGRISSLRVLDFGCGYKYPLVALLQRDVAEVVGLDVLPVYRDGLKPLVRAFSESGGFRGLAWGVLRHHEARLYHKHLAGRYGSPRNHDGLPLVRYDGTRLPFEDGSFDCVVSNAVLMEIPGSLKGYAREIARVLAPGGAVDLEWHNFYSWSGGLTHEEHRNPWGHLLGGCYWEPLNRVTPRQMVDAFSPWFDGLQALGHDRRYRIAGRDPSFEPEAESYLTPELERRLSQYPREMLLTRGFILQGLRNRAAATPGRSARRAPAAIATPQSTGLRGYATAR